jgi:ABC-type nitrate/sulfonate/bicarbonate transport system substrate-binding protein
MGGRAAPKQLRFARYPGQSARIIFAPVLIAQDRGYFADEGLDVTILEPDDHPWQAVARNDAEIGVGYIDYCARPEFRGRITAVAVQERLVPGRGLPALLARPALLDAGALHDESALRGKRIGLTWGRGDDYLTFAYVLERAGLTIDDVSIVPVPHEGERRRAALAAGEIDVIIGRRPRQIMLEEAAGSLRRWLVGGQIRASWQNRFIIYATSFIERDPDAGAAFLRAHQRAVADVLAGTASGYPSAAFLPELVRISEETPDLLMSCLAGAFPAVCAIDAVDLARDVERMRAVGLFPANVEIADVVDTRFAPELRQLSGGT